MAATEYDPFAKTDNVTEGPWGDGPNTTPTRVVATLKGAATTGAPWVIVEGGSSEAVADELDSAAADRLIDNTVKAQLRLEKGYQEAAGIPAASANKAAPAKDEAPNGETMKCKHGEMQFRSGSTGGRAWKAFMCPTPKGTADQCPPEWIK